MINHHPLTILASLIDEVDDLAKFYLEALWIGFEEGDISREQFRLEAQRVAANPASITQEDVNLAQSFPAYCVESD